MFAENSSKSFILFLDRFLLYDYTTVKLHILLMDIWVVSSLELLQVMLLFL